MAQDYATKQDIQQIVDTAVVRVVDDIAGIIKDFSDQVAEKFAEHDKRFDTLESRFDSMEKRMDGLDSQMAMLMRRMERGDDRITAIETMLKAIRSEVAELRTDNVVRSQPKMLARLDKIERWIEQIAQGTGITLAIR